MVFVDDAPQQWMEHQSQDEQRAFAEEVVRCIMDVQGARKESAEIQESTKVGSTFDEEVRH